MPRLRRFLRLSGSTALLLAAGLPLHAADRITLRNGFSWDCARHEPLDPTHTRLYLLPAADTNFVDVPSAEIVAVDKLPNLPPLPHSSDTAARPPEVDTLLSQAGEQHNIDAALLASIVHAESNGRAQAVSRSGAEGLMQLMPSTAHAMGVHDAFQPEDNIKGGTAYFDWLLTRYRDNLALALAAYNAGPGAVDRFHGVPPFPETRAYVARVIREFKRRKEALERSTLHASVDRH